MPKKVIVLADSDKEHLKLPLEVINQIEGISIHVIYVNCQNFNPTQFAEELDRIDTSNSESLYFIVRCTLEIFDETNPRHIQAIQQQEQIEAIARHQGFTVIRTNPSPLRTAPCRIVVK